MHLYITEYSPYVRMVRILIREKNLQSAVGERIALTRQAHSPYYAINPSGRVPYLTLANGEGIQGSRLILAYLDQFDDKPLLDVSNDKNYWQYARLEESARVVMDGVSVWCRELKRPANDRSGAVIEHERARAARMVHYWEQEIDNDIMQGPLNYPQLTLACALCLDQWNPYFQWREQHPKLSAWLQPLQTRPSFIATCPPSTL